MTSDFESAHAIVQALVEDFDAHKDTFLAPSYSEAQARLSFIDKFWTALGWDVTQTVQKNPYEQEVRVEKTVSVGGGQKRADYAFHLAPNFSTTLFFVEAKKPSATLDLPENCFQLIRYAWNSNCPLSVLHDFEELIVLDCRWRPDIETAQGRIWKRFHYTDFLDQANFRSLYYLFSREAVLDGAITKRAAELPKPRGKSTQRNLFKLDHSRIDEAFLDELECWRADLATSFKRDNPNLDSETLTEVTQRTLDRLVFLRFLEDKGIEMRTTVGNLGGGSGDPWEDFRVSRRRLDRIYNGAIFHAHPVLDSDTFSVNGDVFARICEDLDSGNSVYDFNVIPIHILGSIYERFLGSIIIATANDVKVEWKPEVKKADGVFYTPEYIVQFIVNNTVGKEIAGKTPDQIEQMSFADISCGSGSFLLGVFDVLLRYHTKWYNENPGKVRLHSEAKYTAKGKVSRTEKAGDCRRDEETGTFSLTLEKKRQILLNNVFGTDLDPQAVEVAQFSLYLKLLEDETAGSTHQYQLDFDKDALLPTLEKNIVCGNALIETDISGILSIEPEEEEVIKPLDYSQEFAQVFKSGGFDAIVGNPPYILLEGEFRDERQAEYFGEKYDVASFKLDTYHLFFERGILLLKEQGMLGFITPSNFLTNKGLAGLRKFLLRCSQPEAFVVMDGKVFAGASVDTAITIASRSSKGATKSVKLMTSPVDLTLGVRPIPDSIIHPAQALADPNVLFTGDSSSLANDIWQKCINGSELLGKVAHVNFGKQLRNRKIYTSDVIDVDSITDIPNSHRPCYTGRDINRYSLAWGNLACLRSEVARSGGCWDEEKHGAMAKLLCRQIGKSPFFAMDPKGWHCLNTIFMVNPHEICPYFLLGILNSKLLSWLWIERFYDKRGTFPKIKGGFLKNLPIKTSDNVVSEQISSLVKDLLDAKEQESLATSGSKQDFWSRKAIGTDRKIDALVYELYGLTPDEIALVEG